MVITDKVAVRGGADYTFVCSKIPFAITCSSELPHGDHNLIDLDLVNKMKIPIKNIKVKRMILLGQNVRYVGSVSQTIQCVNRGKVCGTIHLQALVVRDLFSLFNLDRMPAARPMNVSLVTNLLNPPEKMMTMIRWMKRKMMRQVMIQFPTTSPEMTRLVMIQVSTTM